MTRLRNRTLRFFRAATCAVLLAAVLPATASAWQAIVLPKGTKTIDVVPSKHLASAVFTSMPVHGATSITFGGGLVADGAADLYVPDRTPERGAAASRLPQLRSSDPQTLAVTDLARTVHEDDATGLRFIHIASLRLSAGTTRVDVDATQAAMRALVVVHVGAAPKSFTLDTPTKVPRTVAMMRSWYDMPADGHPRAAKPHRSATMLTGAILGALVVIAMLGLAVWWGIRGRSASRRRATNDA